MFSPKKYFQSKKRFQEKHYYLEQFFETIEEIRENLICSNCSRVSTDKKEQKKRKSF